MKIDKSSPYYLTDLFLCPASDFSGEAVRPNPVPTYLFHRASIYRGHPETNSQPSCPIGVVVSARHDAIGNVIGDCWFYKSHPAARRFIERVHGDRRPALPGFSTSLVDRVRLVEGRLTSVETVKVVNTALVDIPASYRDCFGEALTRKQVILLESKHNKERRRSCAAKERFIEAQFEREPALAKMREIHRRKFDVEAQKSYLCQPASITMREIEGLMKDIEERSR